jgi:hypothetical protein
MQLIRLGRSQSMAWKLRWKHVLFLLVAVVVPLLAACPSNSGGGY